MRAFSFFATVLSVMSTVGVLTTGDAKAELVAEEVAILAMAGSDQSQELARYYAKVRGIPESNILLLEGEPRQSISRARWREALRPAIQTWLLDDLREGKIRCLVTCWDVPLTIEARKKDALVPIARHEFLTHARERLVEQFADLLATMASVAVNEGDKSSMDLPTLDPDIPSGELATRFESTFRAVQVRLRAVEDEEAKAEISSTLERAFLTSAGIGKIAQMVSQQIQAGNVKPALAQRLELLRGQIQGLAEGLKAFDRLPESVERDVEILESVRKVSGLMGALQWVDARLEVLDKNETHASFDSELSLVLMPDYSVTQQQRNLLCYRFTQVPIGLERTLMVSRLAAPTFELTKQLVDTAVEVERTGLSGKAYLDMRGIPFDATKDKPGSHGHFDQSLRDLAKRIKDHTSMEVVIDEEASLFSKGECPNAALYCGWYSLAKYIDAFEWNSGAIGYHLAGAEAATLQKPGAMTWCSAMLEDGVSATLGPVHDPKLAAFPLPEDFFSLLLTGRLTLVESYYLAKPFNSWAMVLVGDPLYNPYGKSRPLSIEHLPERLKSVVDPNE